MNMSVSLLKESHEKHWLEAGYNLLLQFREGWVAFRIKGREPANLKPFSLGDVSAVSNLSAWNEIKDSENRRYLEPHDEDLIYHEFWGHNKPNLRVYWQYPPREDIGSVLTVSREITGAVGYVDGDESPYGGPYSPKTEIIAVHERYPAFQAYNPLSSTITNALMSFDYMKYTYQILKDQAFIRELLLGNKPARKYTMGRLDPNPMTIPDWLKDLVGTGLLAFTKSVMEAA